MSAQEASVLAQLRPPGGWSHPVAESRSTAPQQDASAGGHRWPLAPLLAAAGVTASELAAELGVNDRTVRKARSRRLSDVEADRWAVGVGLHPASVWGYAWFASAVGAPASQPSCERVADDLRSRIDRGELRPGDQVPLSRELVATYGVGDRTATRALAQLRAEGRLIARRGRRAIVAPHHAPVGGSARGEQP